MSEFFTLRIYVAVESFGEDIVVAQGADPWSTGHYPKLSALGGETKEAPREGEGRKRGVKSDERRRGGASHLASEALRSGAGEEKGAPEERGQEGP